MIRISTDKVEVLLGLNGNAYSASRRLYESIKVTSENTISHQMLHEDVDWTVDKNKLGGVIVFSTDVNAVNVSSHVFINWIKKKLLTIENGILSTKKIDSVAKKHNLLGWTVGKFLSGRYMAKNGVTFGENSLSIEIIGVDSDTLISIGEDICNQFNQETVLIKDYTTGNIYFVKA